MPTLFLTLWKRQLNGRAASRSGDILLCLNEGSASAVWRRKISKDSKEHCWTSSFVAFYVFKKKSFVRLLIDSSLFLPFDKRSSVDLERGISKAIESLNFLLFVLISFREIYSFEISVWRITISSNLYLRKSSTGRPPRLFARLQF